jgi:hypothetical protein
MKNFGMNWGGTDNFIGGMTDEENLYMEPRRIETGPKFGGPYPEYLDILFWLCVNSQAKRIIEIGAGHTTIPLLLAARRNGGRVFSIDIGAVDNLVKSVWKFPYSGGDIWDYKFNIDSITMGRLWVGGQADFIYLDTTHDYERTKEEINIWIPHLKIGGWMVFHDVQSCVTGVFKAISEFLINNATYYEYHQYNIAAGFGILIKTQDYDIRKKK